MKKLLSLLLSIAVLTGVCAALMPHAAAASGDTLTITCRGQVLGEVEVGNEFIYQVSFFSGNYSVMGGTAEVNYDSDYVRIVEYGDVKSDGSVNMNAYCFPARIRSANLTTNYTGVKNQINYNFSSLAGAGKFEIGDHYFKIRFKALKPGTVEIKHIAKGFYHIKGATSVKLIRNNVSNDQLDPIPYMISSVEPAQALIGDADGDGSVTVMDATYIQYLAAGADYAYKPMNTDVNADGSVNLKDALAVLRYKAGVATETNIGEWIFASEQ